MKKLLRKKQFVCYKYKIHETKATRSEVLFRVIRKSGIHSIIFNANNVCYTYSLLLSIAINFTAFVFATEKVNE